MTAVTVIVFSVSPRDRMAMLRTSGDGYGWVFALTDDTPLRWNEVQVGQRLYCDVTMRPPRVLRARLAQEAGLLQACAASGQMSAAQIAAHERAGELALRTRRVQEEDLRWSRDIGYEAGQPHLNREDEPTNQPWSWIPDRPGRALLIYAGTLLASALAAAAWFINT